jgi:hypothetical protein
VLLEAVEEFSVILVDIEKRFLPGLVGDNYVSLAH